MIKVYKSKCINNLSYDQTEFKSGELYFAYVIDSKIAVINGDSRKGFCNMEKCMLRHGHPYGFQKYFEVIDTLYAKNEKEIRLLHL
ncbi:hypothetical protein ACDN41_12210 [Priestia aryabhattai]|uniref:hypothetical protein n=1 Tax=Priestia aryabhattai TaxID=412384 RepID=UPI00353270CA